MCLARACSPRPDSAGPEQRRQAQPGDARGAGLQQAPPRQPARRPEVGATMHSSTPRAVGSASLAVRKSGHEHTNRFMIGLG